MDAIVNFLQQTGFYIVQQNPLSLVMLVVSCVLLYLAIVKQFEPLLLLPIAFGMLLTNLPGAEMYHEVLFANGHVQWELFGGATVTQEIIDEIAAGGATQTILDELTSLLGSTISVGLLDVLYLGVKLGVYPCLIFVGVGAMTDFGPLIANPKSLLLGAAAQLGIFVTYIGATLLGFTGAEASSIGIIGGAGRPPRPSTPPAPGPPSSWAHCRGSLLLHGVGACHPAAHHEGAYHRQRAQDQDEAAAPRLQDGEDFVPHHRHHLRVLPGALRRFSGGLPDAGQPDARVRRCGAPEQDCPERADEHRHHLPGRVCGRHRHRRHLLSWQTLGILLLGIVAFGFGTAGGVLLAKLMNVFSKEKVNPLIGSAGVSAVPMAARVSQVVAQKYDPSNFLLMHAMGPNVSGVIGSAVAAGVLLALFGG